MGPQGPAGIAVGNSAFSTQVTSLGSPRVILQTFSASTAGVYYVNASAELYIDISDAAAYCYVTPTSSGAADGNYGGSSVLGNYQQASIVDFFFLSAGDSLQLVCFSSLSDSNTAVQSAAMTATLITNPAAVAAAAAKPKHVVIHSGDPKAPE